MAGLADYSTDYLSAQIAQIAAHAAFENAQAAGFPEQIALQKAKEAFDEKMGTAQMTGVFDGQPTWSVDQALGVAPSASGGGPLLSQQELYGNASGSAGGGLPTENARQFNVSSSGYLANGDPTLQREQDQNQTTLGYLNILKDLRGPANAFQYARVLNGTPQGLRDIVNAAAGRYTMPTSGGGAPAVNPDGSLNTQEAGLGTMLGDVNGGGASRVPQTGALPNPNQIDLRNYARMSPTQQGLLMGDYENQGWDPNDVKAMLNAAAPAYTGPSRGVYGSLFSA